MFLTFRWEFRASGTILWNQFLFFIHSDRKTIDSSVAPFYISTLLNIPLIGIHFYKENGNDAISFRPGSLQRSDRSFAEPFRGRFKFPLIPQKTVARHTSHRRTPTFQEIGKRNRYLNVATGRNY